MFLIATDVSKLKYDITCKKYLGLLLLVFSVFATAAEQTPDCFPTESAWENIEFKTFNLSNGQQPVINREGHTLSLTFNQFESYLPQFYAFAFLRSALPDIPEIKDLASLKSHFDNIKLVALTPSASDEETSTYQFIPPNQGTWVIYLVAAIDKIPYLELRNLRISPHVENVRGGSVFSGSSLNLSEPVDYKACVVQLER